MLDVKRNRLDYGRLLMPPAGFRLQQAVATCFSVDLDTLLSIPVALYYAQTMEGQLQGKDIELIRAIQQTAQMLSIYHQEGQIRVPRSARNIYAYFEDALVPVLPENAFTSFHPKTWVLRYESADAHDDVVFRLIVLSRNLTFDRSWDVAACLEGSPGTIPLQKNAPLVEFCTSLHRIRPFLAGQSFLDELARVEFQPPDGFSDFEFHPIGIPQYSDNPITRRKADRLLCISPFLHADVLTRLAQNSTEPPILLSRRIELEQITPSVLSQLRPYCLSDVIVDGERLSTAEEGDTEPQEQDLHAKLFLFETAAATHWVLGSANATAAAFERNVEFMIELEGSSPTTRLPKVLKQLLGNDELSGLFVAFRTEEGGMKDDAENAQRVAVRQLEYAILKAAMRGSVSRSDNQENFDLSLTLDLEEVSVKSQFSIMVRPFVPDVAEQGVQPGRVNLLNFANISETSLSRFVSLTIRDGDLTLREFLVRIEIEGIPSTRLHNIFRGIIDSRDKFFSYLCLLLTDEMPESDSGTSGLGSAKKSASNTAWEFDVPVFEQLLVTASRNPQRLCEIDRVIASLLTADENNIIPPEFLSMWEVFKSAIPHSELSHE
jgi:hypothetical protein